MHPVRILIGLLAMSAAALAFGSSSCSPDGCAEDSCGDGSVCGADGICSQECAVDVRCPSGNACVPQEDGTLEGVCLATEGASLGAPCDGDVACASGACSSPENGRCVAPCDLDLPCEEEGLRCTLAGLRRACVEPTDSRAAGEPCALSNECVSGTCVRTPGVEQAVCADNCQEESDCADSDDVDQRCVRLEGGARACVAASPDGAVCTANEACVGNFCIEDIDGVKKCASPCVDGSCAAGFGCEPAIVEDEDVSACMPVLDDRAAGEDCSRARECLSGHCARFAAGEQDFGTLCADPCQDGQCGDGLVCWEDPNGTDVCGPTP